MSFPGQRSGRFHAEFVMALLALCTLAVALSGPRRSRAATNAKSEDDEARQVTVFGIIATPGAKTADSTLSGVHAQLDKLLPKHGFKLLDVQSKSIVAGENVTCNLSNGYTVVTTLVRTVDENGKVELRRVLLHNENQQVATQVKTPPSQLFFCQQALEDGTQLLIGVGGARSKAPGRSTRISRPLGRPSRRSPRAARPAIRRTRSDQVGKGTSKKS